MHICIIAEAGVNHNGSIEQAFALVDAAKSAGADFVKFQTFQADQFVSAYAPTAAYQRKTTGLDSQQAMLKNLELSYADFLKLKDYCDNVGISFLSTPFDIQSIAFLETLKMPFWKIPSGEVTDYPYLVAIAQTGRPVVMSTGMCVMKEIETAVGVLRDNGAGKITLLHCSTNYPTPYKDVNLRAMVTLRDTFGVDIGYSDHTRGTDIPIAAAALGASIIEKHFTLDRNQEGPDHRASLEPNELQQMVQAIRHVEAALGTGIKEPTEAEKKNVLVARKSIVAKTRINKGEIFTEENVTVKRPGNGLSPMLWREVLGSRAERTFQPDELIEL